MLVNCWTHPRKPAGVGQFGRASPSPLAWSTGCWTTMCGQRKGRSSPRRFAVGRFPQLSDKQAHSARSAILHESHEDTAAIRYCRCVITPYCAVTWHMSDIVSRRFQACWRWRWFAC